LPEPIASVKKASEYIRMALSQAHRFIDERDMQDVMKDFGNDAIQLMGTFSNLRTVFHDRFNGKFNA